MYSVVEVSSVGLIEVIRVKTIEEALDMQSKWMLHTGKSYEVLEVV